jgi:hypothetical protein
MKTKKQQKTNNLSKFMLIDACFCLLFFVKSGVY